MEIVETWYFQICVNFGGMADKAYLIEFSPQNAKSRAVTHVYAKVRSVKLTDIKCIKPNIDVEAE